MTHQLTGLHGHHYILYVRTATMTIKYLLDVDYNGKIVHYIVDTTIKDSYGHSAFHTSMSNKHTDVGKLLTDVGNNEAEKQTTTTHA